MLFNTDKCQILQDGTWIKNSDYEICSIVFILVLKLHQISNSPNNVLVAKKKVSRMLGSWIEASLPINLSPSLMPCPLIGTPLKGVVRAEMSPGVPVQLFSSSILNHYTNTSLQYPSTSLVVSPSHPLLRSYLHMFSLQSNHCPFSSHVQTILECYFTLSTTHLHSPLPLHPY